MKRLALKAGTVERARKLRRDMTPQERMLWRGLKEAFPDTHFRKQVPLGPYYADFACHIAKLVIELDGSQHADAVPYDADRTAFLESEGYAVLRFWNNDVTTNLDGVIAAISGALSLPLVGRGRGGGQPRLRLNNSRLSNGDDDSKGAQTRAAPAFRPPHRGEETKGQPPVGVQ